MPDDTSSTTGNSSTEPGGDETLPGTTPEVDAPPAKKAAKRAPAKKAAAKKAPAKRAAKKAAPAPEAAEAPAPDVVAEAPAPTTAETPGTPEVEAPAPVKKTPAKRTTRKVTARKVASAPVVAPPVIGEASDAPASDAPAATDAATDAPAAPSVGMPLFQAPDATVAPARRTRKRAAPAPEPTPEPAAAAESALPAPDETTESPAESAAEPAAEPAVAEEKPTRSRSRGRGRGRAAAAPEPTPEPTEDDDEDATEESVAETDAEESDQDTSEDTSDDEDSDDESDDNDSDSDSDSDGDNESDGGGRRRRRRGGRRRRKAGDGDSGDTQAQDGRAASSAPDDQAAGSGESAASDGGQGGNGAGDDDSADGEGSSRRRRRRRRGGDDSGEGSGEGSGGGGGTSRARRPRNAEDEITSISGSTRLEAKKQRRRDGREAGRRRAPIVSEAEFLARREAVDRVMVIRQRDELTQIGVLEDKVLVEHYVARESQVSLIGNVYLGRVQNVLPSMEAAFIDIGKGRNAVLYAGEVNWSSLGHKDGQPRKIESVLSSGQSILVQVTKDPIGQKGARLSSQVSLAGRFLVYVPDGTTSGISRKLPDTERNRLKTLLKEIVPESAGVIVRTAAEGASEDELTRDVERLKARWEDIEGKAKGSAPQLLYGEPDLTLKVVRDLFTEDFNRLVIEGDDAWDTVTNYVSHVAPDLAERLERYEPEDGRDIFAAYRVEEQIAKGLDRKVFLPSGGSLVIDRTEAMTVVDVNTGKFTGSGGNLEETVTKNNLEAAEEIVRQLRLRDIGGIIVVDFIDMVLESNRDLVLRRLVECLGRDRTRHQVAEVTSLGLVQMTRKRIGTGLVESFSENCSACQGRGVVIHEHPVEPHAEDDGRGRGGSGGNGGQPAGRKRGRGRGQDDHGAHDGNGNGGGSHGNGAQRSGPPTPKDVAAMARPENAERPPLDEVPVETPAAAPSVDDGPVEVVETPTEVPQTAPEVTETATTTEAAPAAPQVVTRTRRGRGGRAAARPEVVGTPAEPAPEPAAEPAAVPEPVVEAAAREAAATPEPTKAPQVVTRSRRRSASRAAGQPEGATVATVVVEAPAPETAPVTAPETTAPAAEAPVAEPPRVVTRTRGRSASRPAGPPAP